MFGCKLYSMGFNMQYPSSVETWGWKFEDIKHSGIIHNCKTPGRGSVYEREVSQNKKFSFRDTSYRCNSYVSQVSQKEKFFFCDTWLTYELHL